MSQERTYFVYILASHRNGTLYIGVTSNLVKRIWEHKNKLVEGFTKKYDIEKLVYCETTNNINAALLREKQLKKWNRQWKLELIEKENPNWIDLATEYYKKGSDIK
ncbi:MAG: GIY-YIG nuclease family protein [Candidatus Moranbacteria bacterium]|nr:GIY-YIG nuclease family protein [Candidatus Moranbacteria bacterium]